VVFAATLAVVGVALVEAALTAQIGRWTGLTLLLVAVAAALLTRAGDRSLPAMMPPLAFLAAALVGGQLLLPEGSGPWWTREGLMLLEVLGGNAPWVVAATGLAVLITGIRHLVDPPQRA
jgi:hypothetical protein